MHITRQISRGANVLETNTLHNVDFCNGKIHSTHHPKKQLLLFYEYSLIFIHATCLGIY